MPRRDPIREIERGDILRQRVNTARYAYSRSTTPDNQRRLEQAESNLAAWRRGNSLHPNERDHEAQELARSVSGSTEEFRARRASAVPPAVSGHGDAYGDEVVPEMIDWNGLDVEARHQARLARRRERYHQNRANLDATVRGARALANGGRALVDEDRQEYLEALRRSEAFRESGVRVVTGDEFQRQAAAAARQETRTRRREQQRQLQAALAAARGRAAQRFPPNPIHTVNATPATAAGDTAPITVLGTTPTAPVVRRGSRRRGLMTRYATQTINPDYYTTVELVGSNTQPPPIGNSGNERIAPLSLAELNAHTMEVLQGKTDVQLYRLLSPQYIALNPLWSAGILLIGDGWQVVDHLRNNGYTFSIKSESFNSGNATPTIFPASVLSEERNDFCPTVVQFRRHARPYRNFLAVGSTVPRAIFIAALLVVGHGTSGGSRADVPDEKMVPRPDIGPGEEE